MNYRIFIALIVTYFFQSLMAVAASIYSLSRLTQIILASIVLSHGLIKAVAIGQLLGAHMFLLYNGMSTYDYVMEQREIKKLNDRH